MDSNGRREPRSSLPQLQIPGLTVTAASEDPPSGADGTNATNGHSEPPELPPNNELLSAVNLSPVSVVPSRSHGSHGSNLTRSLSWSTHSFRSPHSSFHSSPRRSGSGSRSRSRSRSHRRRDRPLSSSDEFSRSPSRSRSVRSVSSVPGPSDGATALLKRAAYAQKVKDLKGGLAAAFEGQWMDLDAAVDNVSARGSSRSRSVSHTNSPTPSAVELAELPPVTPLTPHKTAFGPTLTVPGTSVARTTSPQTQPLSPVAQLTPSTSSAVSEPPSPLHRQPPRLQPDGTPGFEDGIGVRIPVPQNTSLYGNSFRRFGPSHKLRRRLHALFRNPYMHYLYVFCITVTAIVACIRQWRPVNELQTFQWVDVPLCIIYCFYTFRVFGLMIVYGCYDDCATFTAFGLSEYASLSPPVAYIRMILWRTIYTLTAPQWRAKLSIRVKKYEAQHTEALRHSSDISRLPYGIRAELGASRAFLRHSWNRIDLLAVMAFWVALGLAIRCWAVPNPLLFRFVSLFRALALLPVLRLLDISEANSAILRSLKVAAPLLLNTGIFILFFWVFFSILGVQCFKSSFQRQCVWVNPENPEDIYVNEFQFCGSFLEVDNSGNLTRTPYLLPDGSSSGRIKGYACPVQSECRTVGAPYDGAIGFDDFLSAFQMVFVIISVNTFSDLMTYAIDAEMLGAAVYFVVGVLVLGIWMVNLFIAVMVSSYRLSQEMRRERRERGVVGDGEKTEDCGAGSRTIVAQIGRKVACFVAWMLPKESLRDVAAEPPTALFRVYWATRFLWLIIILLSVSVQAWRRGDTPPEESARLLLLEFVFSELLAAEMILRFAAYGREFKKFFRARENVVDGVIAFVSAVIVIPPIRARLGSAYPWLTIFQLLRFYRIALALPATSRLWRRVIGTGYSIINLSLFCFLFLALSSVIGAVFFEGVVSEDDWENSDNMTPFNSYLTVLLGLFQLTSTENWTGILYTVQAAEESRWMRIFDAAFLILWFVMSNMVVLNVFIAVISDNLELSYKEKVRGHIAMFVRKYADSLENTNRRSYLAWLKARVLRREAHMMRELYAALLEGDAVEKFAGGEAEGEGETEGDAEGFGGARSGESGGSGEEEAGSHGNAALNRAENGKLKAGSPETVQVTEFSEFADSCDSSRKSSGRMLGIFGRYSDSEFPQSLRATLAAGKHHGKRLLSRGTTTSSAASDRLSRGSLWLSRWLRWLRRPVRRLRRRIVRLLPGPHSSSAPYRPLAPKSHPVHRARDAVRQLLRHISAQFRNPFYMWATEIDFATFNPATIASEVLREHDARTGARIRFLRAHPRYNYVFWFIAPSHPLRRICQQLVPPARGTRFGGVAPNPLVALPFAAAMFVSTVVLVALTCVVTPMSLRNHVPELQGLGQSAASVADVVFLVIFTIECGIKVVADGFAFTPNAYLASVWNCVDLLVLLSLYISVNTSVSSNAEVSRAFGAVKALRALRLLTVSSRASKVFHDMIISGLGNLCVAMAVALCLLFPYSIWGLNLFAGRLGYCTDSSLDESECINEFASEILGWDVLSPAAWKSYWFSFDSMSKSLLTMFEITSQEGWTDVWAAVAAITGRGAAPQPLAAPGNGMYIAVYNFLGTVFILTMFVAVVITYYAKTTGSAFLTEAQQAWAETERLLARVRLTPRSELSRAGKFRRGIVKIWEQRRYYRTAVAAGLLFIAVGLLLEIYPTWRSLEIGKFTLAFAGSTLLTGAGFIAVVALGPRALLSRPWDVYLALAGTAAFISTAVSTSMPYDTWIWFNGAKLCNVLCLFLVIPLSDTLDQLAKYALGSGPVVCILLFTWGVLFITYAIAMNQIFGLTKLGPNSFLGYSFRNIPQGLVLLFRMSFGEGWDAVMSDYTVAPPHCIESRNILETDCGNKAWAYFLFISWNILSMYMFLSMFVSLILENFSYVSQHAGPSRQLTRPALRQFKTTWRKFDPRGSGAIAVADLPRLVRQLDGVVSLGRAVDPPYGMSLAQLRGRWFRKGKFDKRQAAEDLQVLQESPEEEQRVAQRDKYDQFCYEVIAESEQLGADAVPFHVVLKHVVFCALFDHSSLTLMDFCHMYAVEVKAREAREAVRVAETVRTVATRLLWLWQRRRGVPLEAQRARLIAIGGVSGLPALEGVIPFRESGAEDGNVAESEEFSVADDEQPFETSDEEPDSEYRLAVVPTGDGDMLYDEVELGLSPGNSRLSRSSAETRGSLETQGRTTAMEWPGEFSPTRRRRRSNSDEEM